MAPRVRTHLPAEEGRHARTTPSRALFSWRARDRDKQDPPAPSTLPVHAPDTSTRREKQCWSSPARTQIRPLRFSYNLHNVRRLVYRVTSAAVGFIPRGPDAGAASDGCSEAQVPPDICVPAGPQGRCTGAYFPQAVLHEGAGIPILQMRKRRPGGVEAMLQD